MEIFLTFDYELFFGDQPGSVKKCMISPTNRLLKIAKHTDCKYTFFVDAGYLLKLESYKLTFPNLSKDLNLIKDQIHDIIEQGHDIQLHIHPHWEKSFYDRNGWHMNTQKFYKLHDFSDQEIDDIVTRYKSYLEELIHRNIHAFRAGGWCIQPFDRLMDTFKKNGIRYDTSVIFNAKMTSGSYSFDFTKAPDKDVYSFENDVLINKKDSFFTEIPISSRKYSPFFYWCLYALGRINPSAHKMVGDGVFMSQPGRKKQVLFNSVWNHVSCDGYYSSVLKKSKTELSSRGFDKMVVIGHPKGMTEYSFKKLKSFIHSPSNKNSFITFDLLK